MPKKGQKLRRVAWTDEERALVGHELHRLGWKKGMPINMLKEAQKVLPKERQRSLICVTAGDWAWIAPHIKPGPVVKPVLVAPLPHDIQHDVHVVSEPPPAPEPPPQNTDEIKLDLGEPSTHFVVPPPAPVQIPLPATISGVEEYIVQKGIDILERIAVGTFQRLLTSGAFQELLYEYLPKPASPPTPPSPPDEVVERPEEPWRGKHNPHPTPAAKTALPTILVLGFKGFQWPPLQEAVRGKLHLKFWHENDAGIATLREKAKGAEAIVSSVDGVGHEAENVIKSLDKKIYRVNGSASQAIRCLKGIAGME